MDLLGHLAVFRANWWKILIVATVVGVASYEFSASHPKVYAADQLMSVASQDTGSVSGRSHTQIDLRVQFYAALGNSRQVANAVRTKLHLTTLSAKQVQSRILVFETATSGILEVTARGRTQLEADFIAGGVSSALAEFVTKQQTAERNSQRAQLQAQISSLQASINSPAIRNDPNLSSFEQQQLTRLRQQLVTLQVSAFQVTPLTVPVPRPGPISPHPKKGGLLGFLVAAILVGEGAVLTRGFRDRFARTDDVEQITNFTGLPVLALVPHGRGHEVLEAFRTLRTNLMFLEGAGRPRTIAITSPNPGAGKSFTAVCLAESAIAVDAAVVLIDADLRRPVLHTRLHCEREPGLSNALRGSDLQSSLHHIAGMPNLTVIPSGSAVCTRTRWRSPRNATRRWWFSTRSRHAGARPARSSTRSNAPARR